MRRREFLASVPLAALPLFLTRSPASAADRPAADDQPSGEGGAALVALCADRWAVAPKAAAAPVVDGKLDDPAWSSAAILSDFRIPYYTTPTDHPVSARMTYDDSAVYFGVSYTQPSGTLSLTGFEILLSVRADGDAYFRIPVVVRDVTPPYSNNWGAGITTVDDAAVSTAVDGGQVTAEVAVPLSSLGGPSVAGGSEWRVNVIAQHEMMTAPLSSWLPLRRTVNMYAGRGATVQGEVTSEALLGSVFLGQLPSAAASAWTPRDLELEYLSFEKASLSFYRGSLDPREGVTLRWKSLADPWVEIADVERHEAGDRIGFSFTHPAPTRNGLYQLQVLAGPLGGGRRPGKFAMLTFDRDSLIHAGDQLYDPSREQS